MNGQERLERAELVAVVLFSAIQDELYADVGLETRRKVRLLLAAATKVMPELPAQARQLATRVQMGEFR